MEFAGNEKKIQTLFRELKLEDEHLASRFGRLWHRAEATTRRPRRAFKISFAVVTSLLVFALSLALWTRTWQWSQQHGTGVANQSTKRGPTPGPTATPQFALSEPKQPVLAISSDRTRSIRRARKLAAERQAQLTARDSATLEARAILSWQAPTTMLMQSPAEDVLTSLPQLDQSVTELKSFLPGSQK